MGMHLKYLDSFLALAECRHFTAAARLLGVTQSTLTKRIQHLEDKLGMKLFERSTTGVQLTSFGTFYLRYANRVADIQDEFDDRFESEFANASMLIFGMIPSSSEYGLIRAVSTFIKASCIPAKMVTGRSEDLETMLANGECDFAFIKTTSPIDDDAADRRNAERFRRILVATDRLVLVTALDHPMARRSSVSLEELSGERFFLEPFGSRPYLNCVALCEQAGFSPSVAGTDGQIGNLVDMVAQGLGVSLLMRRIVPDDPRVALVTLEPPVTAHLYLCHRRDGATTHLQRRFLDFWKDSLSAGTLMP